METNEKEQLRNIREQEKDYNQQKYIYLLLHHIDKLEKWVREQNPPVSAFKNLGCRYLAEKIKYHYENHSELLTRNTYQNYVAKEPIPKDRAGYELAYFDCFSHAADINDFSLLAENITAEHESKAINDTLAGYAAKLKKGEIQGSKAEYLKAELSKIEIAENHTETPIQKFEQLYYPKVTVPVSGLPKICRDYISTYTDVLTIPADYIALPILAAIGSAAGKYYRFFAENSNYVRYPNIWTAIIGEPGLKKTTALSDIIAPIRIRDRELAALYTRAVKAYQKEHNIWEQDKSHNQQPTPPTQHQHTFDQTTVQNFFRVLRDNPRGLLLYQDEISKFIKKMITDADGSLETFLEIHTYGDVDYSIKGNSASKHERTINHEFYDIKIPNPVLTIIGGVQPVKLQKLLTLLDDDGFSSRFVIAYPDAIEDTKYDYNRKLDSRSTTAYTTLINNLLNLQVKDAQFQQTITLLDDTDTINKFNDVCNKYNLQIAEYNLTGNIKYTLRKARDFFVRIALILHIIKMQTGEFITPAIDIDTLDTAEKMTDYVIAHYYKFWNGYKTIFNTPTQTETEDTYSKIRKWVCNNKTCMPVRRMVQNNIFTTIAEAEQSLKQLSKQGKGFFMDDGKSFMSI